jgi:hypothetical protein
MCLSLFLVVESQLLCSGVATMGFFKTAIITGQDEPWLVFSSDFGGGYQRRG